ncbi:MAG: hypothetical protein M3N54_00810 [Acidobacteriota bacterium]|nr:hypothetical protein [Acidobacteriota bacterium]
MKLTLKISLLFGCAAFAAFAVEPSATLFENDQVKVARALEKPHVKGGFHQHKANRVMVYLQNGQQKFEYQDTRKPAVFDWHVGQVAWSPVEGMHSPEVLSDNPFNIIEVELKKPGAEKKLAKVDKKHATIEFENPQVRVLRVKLAAHEKSAMRGETDAVAIYLTDAAGHKMGDAVWEPAGAGVEENKGDQALEMIRVELKN